MTDPAALPRVRRVRVLAVVPVALLLLAAYVWAAFGLPGEVDLLRYSSSIYDMDVARVVSDLATSAPSYRASVHPLQKLLVSPFGRAFDRLLFGGESALGAAKVVVLLCMLLASLASGLLARQLTRGSDAAALAAVALCGFSFSTWLAASIPESAAVASLAAVAPLLLSNARFGQPFPAWEAVAWGALGVLGFGLTLTQLSFVAIGLAVRMTLGRAVPPARARVAWRSLALAVAVAIGLGAAGLTLQSLWYMPATPPKYGDPITGELPFLRTGSLAAAPARQLGRLAWHFAVVDFAAPRPARSDFLMRDFGLAWESLSLEEARLEHWSKPQRALALAVLLFVLVGCWGLRRADARFTAPLLALALQFALHLVYGREYVLYAPHWQAVWVAVLVAGVWRAFPRRSGALLAAALALALALFANDVVVMRASYDAVAADLGVSPAGRGQR